ncbi:MAG: hypothetical protein QOF15_4174 [Mycobacterium sp.]|jgi:hypothetical protein|nr:hypothetical protein [Mycobacterium sp.]MDT7692136.1 hypothetical protein [Pseudonocardiales bacterium]
MSRDVDRTVEELDQSMRALRQALSGIPFRAGGFKNTHDNLAREVAHLTVLIDAARSKFTN